MMNSYIPKQTVDHPQPYEKVMLYNSNSLVVIIVKMELAPAKFRTFGVCYQNWGNEKLAFYHHI